MDNIYTEKEVKAIFSEKLIKYIESLEEKGVQIIKKNVTIKRVSGVFKMNADFLAVEKTGISQKTRIIQMEDPAIEKDGALEDEVYTGEAQKTDGT